MKRHSCAQGSSAGKAALQSWALRAFFRPPPQPGTLTIGTTTKARPIPCPVRPRGESLPPCGCSWSAIVLRHGADSAGYGRWRHLRPMKRNKCARVSWSGKAPPPTYVQRPIIRAPLSSCSMTVLGSASAAGCPILNFAFFAKFRVGMLEADPKPLAVREGRDRVEMDDTKTRRKDSVQQ